MFPVAFSAPWWQYVIRRYVFSELRSSCAQKPLQSAFIKIIFWPVPFRLPSAAVLEIRYTDEHKRGNGKANGREQLTFLFFPMPQKYFCALWQLHYILLMVYCTYVHIQRFLQPKLAWTCIKLKDQTTSRGLSVSMFNYFLAICPSVLPSVGQFVHQSTCLCH